jgi:hypothetical protein
MRRRLAAVVAAVAVVAAAGPAAAAPASGEVPEQVPGQVLKVGAASRSVLPTVDGSHAYLEEVVPDPAEPFSPGVPVPAFDQGRVAVGNGEAAARWVHDDLEVTAVAFEDGRDVTVVVAANLYMVLRADGDAIREEVAARLDPELADRVEIAIHADHNHHGPDTAFDVNHDWYELFIDQAADAVVEAIDARRPARLEVAETEHWFGLRDSRDPRVLDPTLGVLRATATNGETIATIVTWANHPEVTLFWDPPAEAIAEDCEVLGLAAEDCSAGDRYFTADFPGWAARILEDELGGEVAYLNGAVGDLVTPLGATVWEVDEEAPLGDGLTAPEGARPPLGAETYTERNFRRTYLVGRALARAALRALADAEPVRDTSITYDEEQFLTRMSNMGFRYLLVVDEDTGRTDLGHVPPQMWMCPPGGAATIDACVADELAATTDPLLGEVRAGDHVLTSVARLRIGPVDTMWLPAEMGAESTIGLPAGYLATPQLWHGDDLSLHAAGVGYETSGFVKNRMDGEYRWVVGLGNDELGYAVPLSDYRVRCVADVLLGLEGACQLLYDAEIIEYPDALAGATCKAIADDPSTLPSYGPYADAISLSCRYGQAFGEAEDHYEETNSAGWDLEADILAAVRRLTGDDDPSRVNPDFPGWWSGLTP